MEILFLQTGGTIDKDYPMGENHHGYNFIVASPAFERILKRVRPNFTYQIKHVLQKDSLDISDEDRVLIFEACKESITHNIIITHGTDTMLQTAKLLSKLRDKTIVMTGAMSPELFKNSDADFNLGTAVGSVELLRPGVYIAMNGSVMLWNEVTFNKETNQFTKKSTTHTHRAKLLADHSDARTELAATS
jgi:L-asparaginase